MVGLLSGWGAKGKGAGREDDRADTADARV